MYLPVARIDSPDLSDVDVLEEVKDVFNGRSRVVDDYTSGEAYIEIEDENAPGWQQVAVEIKGNNGEGDLLYDFLTDDPLDGDFRAIYDYTNDQYVFEAWRET